ncbi:hypothetical protein ABZS66_12250 [Dactylosporangium sp. NPDC005572]|uniref:helix-turn-helix domain-containing protein n=1 Tax=Dactylosporangium sp. NPDC005572 TaxID=3156889 RepID=UPI0033BE90F9
MMLGFETIPGAERDMIAALHPADLTCRPQIVNDYDDSGIAAGRDRPTFLHRMHGGTLAASCGLTESEELSVPAMDRRRCARCRAPLAMDNDADYCASCEPLVAALRQHPQAVLPPAFWNHPPIQAAARKQHMGNLVAAYRRNPHHGSPISQEIVGEWAGMSQTQVSRMETGQPEQHIDRLRFWATLLHIPHDLLWFELAPGSAPAVIPRGTAKAAGRGQQMPETPAGDDRRVLGSQEPEPFDATSIIDDRRRLATESNVDESVLAYLDAEIRDIIATYEQRQPLALAPYVRGLRARVHELLEGRQPPHHREHLYVAAAKLSGIHGVLALDLGEFALAGRYGAEAFAFADAVHEPDLQAWVRGGQSLIAYYSGQYHDALAYARDGYARSPDGPQAVRLAINGQARALARLGHAQGVDEAVERGLTALDDRGEHDVSPSLALEPYCQARTAANAATAYLILGRHQEASTHARLALEAFDRAELHGPRALSRLDLATAELHRPRRELDLEFACTVAAEALTLTTDHAFESVTQRAKEFLTNANQWSNHTAVQHVAELLQQRTQRALTAIPSTP